MKNILSATEINEIRSNANFDFDKQIQSPDYYFYMFTGDTLGECVLTGTDKTRSIKESHSIIIQNKAYKVSGIWYRDHAGVFINPEDKKGTFFKASLSFFADLTPPKR